MTEARSLAVIEGERAPERGAAGLPAVTAPPSPAEWEAMKQQAAVIARSGLAPKAVNTPEKVLVIALKGRELSVPPMQALSHIHVIEGKPAMSAELMVALVLRAGHKVRVIESSAERCVVEGVRADDPHHASRETFSMADARAAGVAGKQVWKQYPKAMLRARATSALCRYMFPDTLMGASYVPEELGAEVDEEGRVVEVEHYAEVVSGAEAQGEVEGETGRAPEHQRLLGEIAAALERVPERERPAEDEALGLAALSERKARAVLARLESKLDEVATRRRSEEVEAETAGWAEQAGIPPEAFDADPETGYANAEQVDYLTELADELYADRSRVLDGHEWLQRELGHPLGALSKEEAKELIDRLKRELRERKEA